MQWKTTWAHAEGICPAVLQVESLNSRVPFYLRKAECRQPIWTRSLWKHVAASLYKTWAFCLYILCILKLTRNKQTKKKGQQMSRIRHLILKRVFFWTSVACKMRYHNCLLFVIEFTNKCLLEFNLVGLLVILFILNVHCHPLLSFSFLLFFFSVFYLTKISR